MCDLILLSRRSTALHEVCIPVMLQVLIVGDFNIAATQQDVHDKLDREAMYPKHEKELFDSILTEFTDVWRKLHPDSVNTFTVWDEKTSARAFNEVAACPSTCRLLWGCCALRLCNSIHPSTSTKKQPSQHPDT